MTKVQTPVPKLLDAPLTQWGINVSWAKFISGLLQNEEELFTDENDQLDLFLQLLWDGKLGMQLPIGTITMFAEYNSIPSKWIPCDGRAISRTTYAALFAITLEFYGVGDGTTTFNVPDLRGRVPMGRGTNGTDPLRIEGVKLGAITHQLTVAEMPAHSHTFTYRQSSGVVAVPGGGGGGSNFQYPTSSQGANTPHNNIQPSSVVAFMIYVGV